MIFLKDKIKKGIDEYIGGEKIFTPDTKRRIMNEIRYPNNFKKKTSVLDYARFSINFLAVIMVISLLSIFVLSENWRPSSSITRENKELHGQISQLEKELEQKSDNENIGEIEDETNMSKSLHGLAQAEFENLGFSGTVDDIKEDLLAQEDIIPYAGVLGGDMHFRSDEIIVLSHEWVFAPFDDGHTGGFLLLTYEMKDGKITQWKVLDSYLYGRDK